MIPDKNDLGALANRINLETKTIHDKLDKSVSMSFIMAMKDYKLYRQGLQAFYHIFVAIERNLNKLELLPEFWDEKIARKESLEKDLQFYYGHKKWLTPYHKNQIEFQQHIDEIANTKPYLLLAYCHVMYLALFAGGQVMKKSLSKNIGFFPIKKGASNNDILNQGMNFFNFDVPSDNDLKLSYKEAYELATRNSLTEDQKLEIIEESKYIFQKNFDCINELEAYNLSKLKTNLKSKLKLNFESAKWLVLVLLVGLVGLVVRQ